MLNEYLFFHFRRVPVTTQAEEMSLRGLADVPQV